MPYYAPVNPAYGQQPMQGMIMPGMVNQQPGMMPPQQMAPQGQQAQPVSNKVYVTSPEDALSRFADYGSTMLYVRQDESEEYEVYTDFQGRKNIIVYKRSIQGNQGMPTIPSNPVESGGVEYVTMESFLALEKKFEALQKKVNGEVQHES